MTGRLQGALSMSHVLPDPPIAAYCAEYELSAVGSSPILGAHKNRESMMRERLDCAVVMVGDDAWTAPFMGYQASGRLVMHPLMIERERIADVLFGSAVALRRYDACLVRVGEDNLASLRTLLSAPRGRLETFLIAYADDLRATAIQDLYALGISDFIRPPFCAESLRARIERLLDMNGGRMAMLALAENGLEYGAEPKAVDEATLCATILQRSGMELEAYAIASALGSATSRESFRVVKGRIVERFEKAYIRAALGRHQGNIAMAARAAQKHRRAFWELMRKHNIDADSYRTLVPPNHPQDG